LRESGADEDRVELVVGQLRAAHEAVRFRLAVFPRLDRGGDVRFRLVAVADETHERDLRGGRAHAWIALDLLADRVRVFESVLERLLRLRFRVAGFEEL